MEKQQKLLRGEINELTDEAKQEEADANRREKTETKKINISQDASFPATPKLIKIRDADQNRNCRVKVFGWVHRLRRQGKNLMFAVIRDGSGYLQCIFTDLLCQTYDAVTLATEASVCLYGSIVELPEGKTAPGNHEMSVDYWELVGASPPGGADKLMNEDAHVDVQLDNRHMMLRGENMSNVMKVRSVVMHCFREHYFSRGYFEVTPPSLVQRKLEQASKLFKVNYFGEKAYLTQSSQRYLETCLPSLGDVFSIGSCFRPEQSRTRRHLAEFSHVEAECAFISFDDLLDKLEDLVVDVVDRVLKSPWGEIVRELNPDFKAPKKRFRRMAYTDALVFLKENNINKDDGTFYEFGDDIPEGPERKMTDMINEPILLCHFPAEIKPYNMQRNIGDRRLTDSVDLLLPNVGETIGGSMRVWQHQELVEAFQKEGTDIANFYWYIDQRKYGSVPHGGYGLGLERFLCWILNRYHIRDVCLYPRFVDRCKP